MSKVVLNYATPQKRVIKIILIRNFGTMAKIFSHFDFFEILRFEVKIRKSAFTKGETTNLEVSDLPNFRGD